MSGEETKREGEGEEARREGEGEEGEERGSEGGGLKKYTWEEVANHRTAESLWIVIHDKVYDLTKFMEEVRGSRVWH